MIPAKKNRAELEPTTGNAATDKRMASSRYRFVASALLVLLVTAFAAFAADRLILKLAEEHQAASPQLSMSAAMGGLFAGGLVALLAILILARSGSPRN